MDITLDDLLVLEPRLALPQGRDGSTTASAELRGSVVSWAVSARTTLPHLPLLRGGEILLAPPRVTAALGADLSGLLREADLRQVSAVVFARADASVKMHCHNIDGMPRLEWADRLNADTEASINRMLTECRGMLYRVGTELERQMSDLTVNRGGVNALVRAAAGASGFPIEILDANGRSLASSVDGFSSTITVRNASMERHIRSDLASGATLVVGPLRPEQRVIARFLVGRIAAAADAALRRDDAIRPRGARRTEAMAALLAQSNGTASDQRALALSLGLDPDGVFVIAMTSGGIDAGGNRILAPLGATHAAGSSGNRGVTIVELHGHGGSNFPTKVDDIKRRWELEHAEDGAMLALSAPAVGVVPLPGAAREARFLATLQAQGQVRRQAAAFESVEDVGALRLLYQLRDSNELRQFVPEALGKLEKGDQRGTLSTTLRVFLESGGSQVEASHRLGIHRNTLAYRLRRIGELVGHDVADPESWLTLHLALRARAMMEVCADDQE